MNITFEERQLMSLYNTGTRTGLIAALEEMRGYLAADETELRELTDSAIAKLRRMSDAEYDALDLFPDFEKEDMDHDLKISSSLLRGCGRYSAVLCGDQGAVCR